MGRAGRRRSGEEYIKSGYFFSALTVFFFLQMAYHHLLDGFFLQEVLTQLGRLSIYPHLMLYFLTEPY
jgi:hypothetical protein